ncbi:CYTOSOL-AP domain-containing protein [Aphelenchoides fujianensis]|nr:CYTOSOL-AP domain-containing protein [Aphelenchoides fujianensis]
MAAFRVFEGLNPEFGLPNAQVVIVGRYSLIKSLPFEDVAEKLKGVTKETFETALQRLQSSGSSIPLHLDLAQVISVEDEVGRHNSPSNSIAIRKKLGEVKPASKVKVGEILEHCINLSFQNLSIVLYSQFEHVLASVSAAARAFPLYGRKTKKTGFENVHLELVVVDGEKKGGDSNRESEKLSEKDVEFLQSLVDSIRKCQEHVDTPCSELHSEAFAEEAERLVDSLNAGVKKTIIKASGEELLKRGFGGIYHVGKAARHPPVFACFSYTPANASESYALVGKGIVYDTGGMQIKGKTAMPSMKVDMGGAAALLGAFCTLVKSGFQQELHCLLCIAENSVSPDANRPDDIITLLSGKTVEVNNTDAEGRLVLADGVFYAKNVLKCGTIVDMATLTMAQQYATGKYHAAVMANKDALELEAIKAGKKSGDLVHPLPYAPELHFESNLKSAVADMKNAQLGAMDGPPSCIAALFIGAHIDFAQDVDWLHVDILSPAFTSDRASGFGVPIVCSLLSKHLDVPVAK